MVESGNIKCERLLLNYTINCKLDQNYCWRWRRPRWVMLMSLSYSCTQLVEYYG